MNKDIVRVLGKMEALIAGVTAIQVGHEIRLLELEGKPVSKEMRDTHLNSLIRYFSQAGEDESG